MKQFIIIFFISLILSCSIKPNPESEIIHIKGSDTMLILNRLFAEEFMRTHPGVSIYVEGGGSESGIQGLINGEVQIAAMSRTIRPKETSALAYRYSTIGLSHLIAKDALSLYLHPNNPVTNLSSDQLKNMYTGKIKKWNLVGGKDEPIIPICRPPNSGTYLYFLEHILEGKPYSETVTTLPTTETIVKFITENKNAIGYGGIAYKGDLNLCKIDGVDPTIENIKNNEYPISRYLYFYTINTPRGQIKSFIDWVLSKEGQRIVKSVGYIPLWE